MSTRITAEMREVIVKKLLAYRFKGVYAGFAAEMAVLAKDLYNERFPLAMRRRMNRLPRGWLKNEHHIYAKFGDDNRNYAGIEFDGRFGTSNILLLAEGGYKATDVWKPFPHNHTAAAYPKEHELSKRYFDIMNRATQASADYLNAKELATQSMARFTTLKQLKSGWPEVWPFVPDWALNPPKFQLPVPQMNIVNKTFRLPVEGAK